MKGFAPFFAKKAHFEGCKNGVTRFKSNKRSHSGDNGDEDPPVPIPNTEVKLVRGESTWHIAPGRITRCRISKKMTVFKPKTVIFHVFWRYFQNDAICVLCPEKHKKYRQITHTFMIFVAYL